LVGATISAGGTVGGIVTSPTGVGAVAGAAVAAGGAAVGVHGLSTAKNGLNNLLGDSKGRVNATPTEPYKRPNNSTTSKQRAAVQGEPCATCGANDGGKRIADHKKPLVQEYYETGTIDRKKSRKLDAVQPQCEGCSQKQSVEMRKYSAEQKKKLGL
jgi:hypothetical protein